MTTIRNAFISSIGIAATLGYLAGRLKGPFALRWFVLAIFGWAIYSLNTYLDAVIYTTLSSASAYKLVMDAFAFIAAGGCAALFFRSQGSESTQLIPQFSLTGWICRLALAWTAFPLIYLGFGKVVEPFVIDIYRQQLPGMTAPGWGEIIPIQMLRSVVFLASALALIRPWNGTRIKAWIVLGASSFLLLWDFYGLQANWLPVGFRLAHTLEILADSLVYAALITGLFTPSIRASAETMAAA